LGIDGGEVGAEDDFFELGGHSMVAMRVVGRIRSEFGVAVSIRELFQARTPAALARIVGAAARALPPVQRVDRPARVPLSAAQERMWMLAQLQETSLPYHYAHVARVRGAVDPAALRSAVRDVLERHESLRTVIGVDGAAAGGPGGGAAYQRILGADEAVRCATAAEESLPAGAGRERDAAVRALLAERLTADFDLRADPPLRVVLVPAAEDGGESLVALVLHHIATDEWSDGPLLRDLTVAYAARAAGRSPQWEPLPVQYADYTLWQRGILGGAAAAEEREYWARTLAALPDGIALPYDRPRPPRPRGTAGHAAAVLPARTAAALRAAAEDAGATMFMALHAVTAAALA